MGLALRVVDAGVLYQHVPAPGGQRGYRRSDHTEGHLASHSLPGFWLEVSWLWQDPLPAALLCLRQILGS
ncbi:MAG: hypothetical protein D9V47_02110 [Clostridia bacterium]|nr:MAG: hypothetical protein D9V47_02110 [Clostridia bacterium]